MVLRRLVAFSIAAALGAAPLQAWAASPTALLSSFFERANSVIRSVDLTSDLEEPRRAIRGLISETFDFRDAAAIALGPAWRLRTAPEQEEFIRLFSDLLERGYLAVFSSKASLDGGVTVQYLGESVTGESASVPTRVRTRAGEELPVEYKLARHGERWTVRDVVIDGVSLVANYRAQFTRILGYTSFPDLLLRMRSGPDAPALAAPAFPGATASAAAAAQTTAPSAQATAPAAPTPAPDPSPKGVGDSASLAATAAAAPPSPVLLGSIVAPRAEAQAPPKSVDAAGPGASAEARRPREPGSAARAEPAKAAPAPREAVATDTGREPASSPLPRAQYWVQLGAFKTVQAARLLAGSLRPQAAVISAGPAPGGGAVLNRVRVGPFADQAHAAAKLRELDARGYPGFVALTRD